MDINKDGIIDQEEIERWRGVELAMLNWDVTQDLIVWIEQHVVESFSKTARILFNSMTGGKDSLKKADFVNWFTRKTTGIRNSDHVKLANSMRKIFDLFDTDNSNIIEYNEFHAGFYRIEAFFEGY